MPWWGCSHRFDRMRLRPMKRVVTGHDGDGKAIVAIGRRAAHCSRARRYCGHRFYELWNTSETPARVDNAPDVTLRPLRLQPAANGSVLRIVDIPPDSAEFLEQGPHAFGIFRDRCCPSLDCSAAP